jgi:hypothetical protein
LWGEELTVHAALEDTYIAESSALQSGAEFFVGDHCGFGLIVKPTQISKSERLQPAYTVVLTVLMEVGMEATDAWDTQLSGGAHS